MKKLTVLSLFDGKYGVNSFDEVFSNVGKRKKLIGKVTKEGYHMVLLTVDGKKLYKNVHRLVATAFIVNTDNLKEVNHIDGNKLNNAVDNLEWCNSSYNQIHARDNSLQIYKINMKIANEIRELRVSQGLTHVELAKIYSIGKTQVGYILQNKRWSI